MLHIIVQGIFCKEIATSQLVAVLKVLNMGSCRGLNIYFIHTHYVCSCSIASKNTKVLHTPQLL